MHEVSLVGIELFRDKFLKDSDTLKILDLGSMDINGCYRSIFNRPNWTYIGADVAVGKNVDVVIDKPYEWGFDNNEFDVVISGQTLEHIEFPWITITEIYRVLKSGGLSAILVPQDCPEHKYPLDCYRYYPDGLRALAKWGKLDTIEVYRTEGQKWTDCLWVGRKK